MGLRPVCVASAMAETVFQCNDRDVGARVRKFDRQASNNFDPLGGRPLVLAFPLVRLEPVAFQLLIHLEN